MKYLVLVLTACLIASSYGAGYQIGKGIWDVTGPAAEVGMMGYANPNQKSAGVHLRLRSRAFVVSDNTKRIVFVSSDTCMVFDGVKDEVIKKLASVYGNMYTHDNVMLSGIHTHSGPAGFSYRPIYNLVSAGFQKENFQTIVNGIFNSIVMAHKSLADGKIYINNGTLDDSNINRSAAAYEANPAEERKKYAYNTDHDFTSLRIDDMNEQMVAAINWFAVHCTSMPNTNPLISSDNKGTASYLFEKMMNKGALPGTGPFIAAFAQSNEGDVSPRTKGAFCPDGTPCDHVKATCGGKSQGCNGIGPGVDAFDSTRIIAQNQVNKAVELLASAKTELSGPVAFAHMYVDMEHVQVSKQFTSTGEDETTCTGALGDAFAGGTTDGPGDFDFTQGTNSTSTNPVWNMLAHFLKEPSTSDVACHHPKPILFLSGGINLPSTWTPSIIPLQIFRIGQLWIIGAPGEFTTMSGRRLRDTVRNALIAEGVADENSYIIIAGLSNEYTHYITTYEEYQIQRYEGGSTLFGPHTLAAYQQEFTRLAQAIARNQTPDSHAPPVDISSKVFNFQTPVVVDAGSFGAIQSGPKAGQVFHANDVVTVVFHGANPRNAFDDSFCDVEQLVNSQWKVVLNDGDIDTKYRWQRTGGILSPTSLSTCEWTIAADAPKGTYRIHHHGTKKSLLGKLSKFDGVSEAFTVA